jgi:hypothetical protein
MANTLKPTDSFEEASARAIALANGTAKME